MAAISCLTPRPIPPPDEPTTGLDSYTANEVMLHVQVGLGGWLGT